MERKIVKLIVKTGFWRQNSERVTWKGLHHANNTLSAVLCWQ